ncbi:MAG: M20/M25/M40 family metallo-hydrolase [Pyrinomonadaceae bacterium]|nr:M20/M25/M40 family metallo-hydrolase [Pyrinomonadaceae bacterium]
MLRRKLAVGLLLSALLAPNVTFAQTAAAIAPAPAKSVYKAPDDAIAKIKDEGMNRSQVMPTLSYLSDVIGHRLTGSPSLKRANEWTRDTMTKWGMQNAHLEAWGPFGRGWVLKNFSAQISEPYEIPLIAYPKAWSPSTNGILTADVVYFDAKTDADFDKYKGQLKGKIVLVSEPRELKPDMKGLATRRTEESLAKLATAPDPATQPRNAGIPPERLKIFMERFVQGAKRANFLMQEGAAMIVDNSNGGFGGTIFVAQASVAQEIPKDIGEAAGLTRNRLQPWQKEAESKMLPQMTMATENYNRLVRMIKLGEKPKMTVNISAEYKDDDNMAYNTIAEIPGTDPKLKDEIVMLGGHIDSWHAGTGATDNGAGVAVAMEAARIIQASGLKPRRTIRVALWSGEEEGLYGSRAYVKQHFGEMQNAAPTAMFGMGNQGTLAKKADYEKLSAYYNLDNGTGKIRGVYMQGNSAARPYFETWLAPFKDAGATTLTLANTGGTDHLSFDGIGLPGFQFIQDEIEYDTLTHHTNQDVFDRIQSDDMKQASTIMATFVYQTAMMDEKFPRKPMPMPTPTPTPTSTPTPTR